MYDKSRLVAVISGSGGALGSTVAARLESDGYLVIGLTRADCDFSDAHAVANKIAEIHAQCGNIDVGIHAAWSNIVRKKLLDTTLDDFKGQFDAGVIGGFAFLQSLGRIMQQQNSGTLIGITSAVIDKPYPGAMGAYVPAKYALQGVLRTLKAELEPFGVYVHEVAPPFMPVGLNKDLPPRLFELMEEKNGPLPTPSTVAESISTLLSGK